MKKILKRIFLLLTFLGPSIVVAAEQNAAPEDQSALQEVVVTAQRRSERLQDVPVSVTAVTAQELSAHGITDTAQLTSVVPGLVFQRTVNEGNFYIRGIGTNLYDPSAEQTVALFIDGVYIPAPGANTFSFNNIDRIEVLKGPQGTLFGRNTTGGVVQVITKDPSHTPSGEVSVGFDNWDTATASVYATTGLTDHLAADLAATYANQKRAYGYDFAINQRNVASDQDYALRSKWLFTPDSNTAIHFSADYSRTLDTESYHVPQGLNAIDGFTTYLGPYNSNTGFPWINEVKTGGISLAIDHDFGGIKLVSITSYREAETEVVADADSTTLVIADESLPTHAQDWTQEIQLQSTQGGPLTYTVGGYFFYNKAGFDTVEVDGKALINDFQIAKSYAGFGQASYEIITDTSFTGGLRYTTENQHFVFPDAPAIDEAQDFSKLTWRLSLDHHFSSDMLGYISWNRGSKSGGFNLLTPGAPGYRPETLDAYELGLKAEVLDHHVRLNTAAFHYKYTDVQVLIPGPGTDTVENGPKARVNGVEADFEALPLRVDTLRISGGASFLDSKFTSYPSGVAVSSTGVTADCALNPGACDFTGHTLPSSPRFTGNLNIDYAADTPAGKIVPSLTGSYNSGYFVEADNRLRQAPFFLLNSAMTWLPLNNGYSVKFWARNITNRLYYNSLAENTSLGDGGRYSEPRTYGVTLGAKF